MNITEYADVLNLQIVVRYYPNQGERWTASFDGAETKESPESSILSSEYGNAGTPGRALLDYLTKIRGKWIVLNAMSDTKRREFRVPASLALS